MFVCRSLCDLIAGNAERWNWRQHPESLCEGVPIDLAVSWVVGAVWSGRPVLGRRQRRFHVRLGHCGSFRPRSCARIGWLLLCASVDAERVTAVPASVSTCTHSVCCSVPWVVTLAGDGWDGWMNGSVACLLAGWLAGWPVHASTNALPGKKNAGGMPRDGTMHRVVPGVRPRVLPRANHAGRIRRRESVPRGVHV